MKTTTQLSPIWLNDTRWSSTLNMLNRFFELKDFIDVSDPDLAPHVPSASETMIVQDLFESLKIFESVSKNYEKRLSQCLKHVYCLIHFLTLSWPRLLHFVWYQWRTCNEQSFWTRTGGMQRPRGNMLKPKEKVILSVFQKEVCVVANDSTKNSFADAVLAKRAKRETFDLKWIPPTSNKAERLFNRVRHIFTDYRKSPSPINLEAQIFLNVNKKHWNVFTVQEIISSK